MNEFALIRHYFASLTEPAADVALGIGDDCALLRVPPEMELAVTTDTLVAGRHFPLDTAPFDIGWKSLAVNLSDLAAMGAEPRWFTLALTLESAGETWLAAFACGLRELAARHRVALVGGDTTRGPLSIMITAMGVVPRGAALRRDGAQVGDVVCVTGTLGDAAFALKSTSSPPPCGEGLGVGVLARKKVPTPPPDPLPQGEGEFALIRLNRPTPRIEAGLALRGIAHAAIDLSDGLAGDLSHVLEASKVGALIEAQALPASSAVAALDANERLALQTRGGDDYELCICLPPDQIEAARARLDVPLAVIGRITAEPGLRFVDAAGVTIDVPTHGYCHFE